MALLIDTMSWRIYFRVSIHLSLSLLINTLGITHSSSSWDASDEAVDGEEWLTG